jgi:type I restriction enzyme S subunit
MVEVQDAEAAPFELRNDDIFIVRYNGDINRVAKAAIYKSSEPSVSIFPDKLMRLRPKPLKMLPDFLVYALGSRGVRLQIEQLCKTTAGNIGISGGNAKSFQIPVPPLQDQHRIVEELDAMQLKVDALKKLQTGTATELGALLPSILDCAFKGEM